MIRALDLELLRGVGLSLVIMVGCYYLFTWFCYRWVSSIGLVQTLQRHWRPFLLLLGVMLPFLNSCYWIRSLYNFYSESYTFIYLILVAMGVEVCISALQSFQFWRLVPRIWWRIGFGVVRCLCYVLLFYSAYNHLFRNDVVEGGFFVALCYTAAVYMVLRFVYAFFFEEMEFRSPLLSAVMAQVRFPAFILVLILTALYAWTWAPPALHQKFPVNFYLGVALIVDLCTIINEAFFVLLFDYLTRVRGLNISKLIKDLSRVIVYVLLALVVLTTVFKVNLSSLLVSSTVASVIIGLALQETMGNLVAGIFLDLAKPYKPGDYIEVNGLEGTVENIDWRSTVLRLLTGEREIIPNSVVAKSTVKNYSVPTTKQARYWEVGVGYQHSPDLVKRVIFKALESVADVLDDPPPVVWLVNFDSSSMTYRLRYWIPNFNSGLTVDSKVRSALWYYFAREGITIPFPITTIEKAAEPPSQAERAYQFLRKLDCMSGQSEDFLRACAQLAQVRIFAPNELVYPPTSVGEPPVLDLVMRGRLQMATRSLTGADVEVTPLECGSIFSQFLVDARQYSVEVTVQLESEIVGFTQSNLERLYRRYPKEWTRLHEFFHLPPSALPSPPGLTKEEVKLDQGSGTEVPPPLGEGEAPAPESSSGNSSALAGALHLGAAQLSSSDLPAQVDSAQAQDVAGT